MRRGMAGAGTRGLSQCSGMPPRRDLRETSQRRSDRQKNEDRKETADTRDDEHQRGGPEAQSRKRARDGRQDRRYPDTEEDKRPRGVAFVRELGLVDEEQSTPTTG